MKKILCCFCGLLLTTVGLRATPLFADSFTYPNGNLAGAGNDGWTQTGTTATSPIQASAGRASVGPSGQDVYAALPGGIITLADNTTLYMGFDLTLSAAQISVDGEGDFFIHWAPTVGSTVGSTYYDRLFAKATTGGYLLGWMECTATFYIPPVYGSTVLSFDTTYRVVTAYHVNPGSQNDTGDVYVNPFTSLVTESLNTPYLSKTAWTSAAVENANVATVNLRQGNGTSSPTLTIDNLDVSQTFSEVTTFTPIPEPASLSLLGSFSLLAWFISRRRR